MAKFNYKIKGKYMLADIISPVSLFLRLRDEFTDTLLLESSDYHGSENSKSFICFHPVATFELNQSRFSMKLPDGSVSSELRSGSDSFEKSLQIFLNYFEVESSFKDAPQGIFGYMNFDAVQYVEDIEFRKKERNYDAPDARYQFFRFVITIDHFKNELYLYEYSSDEKSDQLFNRVLNIIQNFDVPTFPFEINEKKNQILLMLIFLKSFPKGKDIVNLVMCFK